MRLKPSEQAGILNRRIWLANHSLLAGLAFYN